MTASRVRALGMVGALALAGCNQLLGLDPPGLALDAAAPPDGDAPDARPDATTDAATDAATCAAGSTTSAVEADAILITGSSQDFGALEVLNVGVGVNSVGLFRFDLAAIPLGATVTNLRLTLPYAPTSNACGSNCGSCSFDAPGALAVHFMRSDWDERTTDWFERAAGSGWASPGATGGLDRSAMVATGAHADDTTTVVDLSPALLPLWLAGTRLSVQVVPGAGTVMIIPAREKIMLENCQPVVPPASLEVAYCTAP